MPDYTNLTSGEQHVKRSTEAYAERMQENRCLECTDLGDEIAAREKVERERDELKRRVVELGRDCAACRENGPLRDALDERDGALAGQAALVEAAEELVDVLDEANQTGEFANISLDSFTTQPLEVVLANLPARVKRIADVIAIAVKWNHEKKRVLDESQCHCGGDGNMAIRRDGTYREEPCDRCETGRELQIQVLVLSLAEAVERMNEKEE